jgi:tetratricopeptide (TPR) repeat protein
MSVLETQGRRGMRTLRRGGRRKSPRMGQRRGRVVGGLWLVLPLLLLALAAVAGVYFWSASRATPIAEVPLPELSQANVQVATLAGQLREEVLAAPHSAAAWGRYGEALMAHEWNVEALACFEQAAALEADQMRWPYLAGVLLERNAPQAAAQYFRQAAELDASYPMLHMRLGKVLLRLNQTREAEAAWHQAAALAPDQPQPRIALARLAGTRNDWKGAVELLEQAVRVAPANREAVVELARAKLMAGTLQSLSREEQAALLSSERYEPMPDPIVRSIDEQEVAARFAAVQADAAAARGDVEQAAEGYAKLIEQRPELVRPRLNLSSLYMGQGQPLLALATLREAVQLFPEDPLARYALSLALEATQDYAGARREREEAVRLKPDYADAHFGLGLLAEREGDAAGAIAAFRRASEADPSMAQAHLALGEALRKQGDLEAAIAEMRAAVRLSPGDPVPQSFLSKALAERQTQAATPPATGSTTEPTPAAARAAQGKTAEDAGRP